MQGASRQFYQNLLVVHYIQLDSRINQISWVLVDCVGCVFFQPVTVKIWHQAEPYLPMSLEHTVLCIFQTLVNLEKDFRSVALATYGNVILEKLLPTQLGKRGRTPPTIFFSYFDLSAEFKECFGRQGLSISQMAAYVGDMTKSSDIYSLANVTVAMLSRQHIFKNMIYIDRMTGSALTSKEMVSVPSREIQMQDVKYFRLRGLPYRVTKRQVREFLDVKIDEESIVFQYYNDKFNGNAIIKVPSKYAEQVQEKHEQNLMSRYIEVLPANKDEFLRVQSFQARNNQRKGSRQRSRNRKRQRSKSISDSGSEQRSPAYSDYQNKGMLKLIGLPYSSSKAEIIQFFEGYHPIPGSIRFGFRDGRRTGDAVILLENQRDADLATVDLDHKKIGSRYIELSKINEEQYRKYRVD